MSTKPERVHLTELKLNPESKNVCVLDPQVVDYNAEKDGYVFDGHVYPGAGWYKTYQDKQKAEQDSGIPALDNIHARLLLIFRTEEELNNLLFGLRVGLTTHDFIIKNLGDK